MRLYLLIAVTAACCSFDLVEAIQPVRLQEDSYAKIPLQSFSYHWEESKNLKSLQVAFQLYETSGRLLHLEGNGKYFSVSMSEGFLRIVFGKNDQQENDIVLNDVMLTRNQVYVINIYLQGQNVTTVVDSNVAKQFHLTSAENEFKLDEALVLHIGDSQQTEGLMPTLPCCLHHVVLNNKYLKLPGGAVESRNLGSCLDRSATSCGQNYCGEDGICYKTIDCDEPLTVEETRRSTSSKSSESHVDEFTGRGGKEQWIEYTFGKLMYIHGFSAGCDAATTNQTNETENGNFSLLFSTDRGFYDYRENNQVKVFNLNRRSYLAWPVAATRVRVRLTFGNKLCHVTVNFWGCPGQGNSLDSNTYMKPGEWRVLIQTPLASLNYTLTSFGVINHSHAPSESQIGSEIKTKWIDILPTYQNFSLSWKVEFVDATTKNNIASWSTLSSECSGAIDKFFLLEELYILARGQSEEGSCVWKKLVEGKITTEDFNSSVVRVSIRRPFQATDAFARLSNLGTDFGPTDHLLSGDSPEQCATACVKNTTYPCFGFQFVSSCNKSARCHVFDRELDPKTLKPFQATQVFILKDLFKSLLPLRKFPEHDEPYLNSDPGYQCQCVNNMIGARCDNDSIHDYTYHVTLSNDQEAINLECPSSDANKFFIKIQFSLGEISAAEEKNPRVVQIVKALCNGKQNCPISVDAINSLLPPSARRIKLLEVRYVCIRGNDTAINNESTSVISSTLATIAVPSGTTAASEREGSASCFDCGEESNIAVFETKHEALPENGAFFLNLFEKPEEPQVVMTSPETTTPMTTMSAENPLKTTAPFTSAYVTPTSEATTMHLLKTTIRKTTIVPSSVNNMCTDVPNMSEIENKTNINETTCPQGSEAVRRSFCLRNNQNVLRPVTKTECISKNTIELSSVLEQITQGKIFGRTVLQTIAERQTEVLKSQKDDVLPGDIIENTKILQRIVYLQTETITEQTEFSKASLNVSESVLASVDTLLDDKLHHTWKKISKNERSSVADHLTKAVDNVGFLMARNMNESKTKTRITENTAIQVVSLKPDSKIKTQGDRISFPEESDSTGRDKDWMDGAGTIAVPLHEDSEEEQSFVFAVYNSLDSLLGDAYEDQDPGDSPEGQLHKNKKGNPPPRNHSRYVVNSCVISASVRPLPRDIIAKKKIKIVLRHRKPSQAQTKCVFWKVTDKSSESGQWSSDGCRVLARNDTHTRCECDHLTNFAILMNVAGVELGKTDDFILTILTWAGCSMSVVCLVTCLFCFNALRGLRSTRNSIHKNLCVTLALAQTIFVFGVDQTNRRLLCTFIAATLHYLFLSVFCWMSIEGLHLYVSLVQVFEIDKRSRLLAYYVFAYGAPALVVAVSVGLRYDGYGNDASCWLKAKDDYLIWSFVGPALAVICVNIGFFIVALKVMRAHRITTPAHRTRLAKAKTWIKGSSVLLCLLGITWIFGVFYVDEKTVVMAYIFTACNALQGVFIFVFHCLMNDRVRAELSKYLRRSNCCPSCVRRRYHVTSSVTARSAYVTTTSYGVKSRNASSGMTDSSFQSVKSSSWIKVKTPDPKLRKIVERQDTPHWKSDLPEQTNSNDKATNVPDDKNEIVEVPYFGLTVTNHNAIKVEEIDDATSLPSTNQQVDTFNSIPVDDVPNLGDFNSGGQNTVSSTSKSPSPFLHEKHRHVDRHNALSRHHSMPVPSRGLSVESSPRHERTIDDSLLFFNLDLSLNLQSLRM